MTKEELDACICTGNYSAPRMRGKDGFSVKIGDETVDISRYSTGDITAYYCIQTAVSQDAYDAIKRRALRAAIEKAQGEVKSLQAELEAMGE
ncbi:MAG: hypothetical protein ACI30J_08200 [Paludibacteraceae bacterium]